MDIKRTVFITLEVTVPTDKLARRFGHTVISTELRRGLRIYQSSLV